MIIFLNIHVALYYIIGSEAAVRKAVSDLVGATLLIFAPFVTRESTKRVV